MPRRRPSAITPDLPDLVRWHLEHCWHVRKLLDLHPAEDVLNDLAYELGRGELVRMEIESPGLYAATAPRGVG